MSAKVSVIIPVYNAERYLAECIDSLVNQTLKDIEFLFVNDGSTDRSETIIERYGKSDRRIRLINQPNHGVSAARNNGLLAATGEYAGFVDADDTVEHDMFETLYAAAVEDGCDVVISNFEVQMGGHKSITKYPFPAGKLLEPDYIRHQLLPYFLKTDHLHSVCNKLYKAAKIKENNVTFPEKMSLGEDGHFNLRFFSEAAAIKYIDYAGYHYKETQGSATRNIANKDYFKRAVEVYESALPEAYASMMEETTVSRLKSIRLIHTVMSIIHIYLEPSREVRFSTRFHYIKAAINSRQVKNSLPVYYEEVYGSLGAYQKLMIRMMRRKFTTGLYLATVYSRMRNRHAGRV